VARDAAGNAIAATLTWSSSDPGVAAVANGTVVGLAPGTAVVTAASGNARGTARVTVLAAAVSLEIQPSRASTSVGGTVPFTAVAKNAAGVIVPAPAVTWSAAPASVASITAGGVATGVTPGLAAISASGGGLTALPASLAVVPPGSPSQCFGIAAVNEWEATFKLDWAHGGTNADNHLIGAEQHWDVNAVLARIAPGATEWNGVLKGTASVNDSDTDRNASPPTTERLSGGGAVLAQANGVSTPPFIFRVDPATCTYELEVVAWIDAKFTDAQGDSKTGPTALGLFLSDTTQVHSGWATTPFALLASFPVHSPLWFAREPFTARPPVFMPEGFGPLFHKNSPEASAGQADIAWVIRRKS